MPHSVSAMKRVRQNERHRLANKAQKSRIRTEVKKFEQDVEAGKPGEAETELRLISKLLDKAAKHNVIHANKAARKKSHLARKLNAARAAAGTAEA